MTTKQILKKAESLQLALEQTVEERNKKFESNSDKWQNSEKGEDFNTVTSMLEDTLCTINEIIDDLSCCI
jgi:Zn-dependent M32 family carboxypeptidase